MELRFELMALELKVCALNPYALLFLQHQKETLMMCMCAHAGRCVCEHVYMCVCACVCVCVCVCLSVSLSVCVGGELKQSLI